MNGQQGQSSIQNIFSRSFTGHNLFEVSLVKDTNPELPFYKPRYFFFISMTPSQTDPQSGQRTYNRQGKVNLKTDVEKILAFAHAIRAHARGQGETFGNFAIFTDPSKTNFQQNNQGYKVCYVNKFQGKNGDSVAINFKVGQNNPFGSSFQIPEAVAIADMLQTFGEKALELEFQDRTLQVGKTGQGQQFSSPQQTQPQNQQNNFQQNPPQQQGGGAQQQVTDNFKNAMENQSETNPGPFIDDAPF